MTRKFLKDHGENRAGNHPPLKKILEKVPDPKYVSRFKWHISFPEQQKEIEITPPRDFYTLGINRGAHRFQQEKTSLHPKWQHAPQG